MSAGHTAHPDGAYAELFDLCTEQGWQLCLAQGTRRQDRDAAGLRGYDLVLELRRGGETLTWVVPYEGNVDAAAGEVLELLANERDLG